MLDIDNYIKKYIISKTLLLSVLILLIGFFFEQIIFTNLYSTFVDNISKNKQITYQIILPILIIFIVSQLLLYLSDIIDSFYIPKIELALSKDVINEILRNPKILNINKNEIILNVKKIADLKNLMHIINSYFIPTVLMSLFVSAYFLYYDTTFGLITLVLLAVTGVILYKLSVKSFRKSQTVEKKLNSWYDDIFDILNNVDSIYVSNTFDGEMNRINKDDVYNDYKGSEIAASNLKFIFSIMYFFIMVIINSFAYKLYTNNVIGTASLVSIFYIVLSLIQYYDIATYELKNLINNIGKYKELKEFLFNFSKKDKDTNMEFEEDDENKSNEELNITNGAVELRDINVKYKEKVVFKDFNLKIQNNTITGIIGEIGSGKTTILKMLIGLIKYEGGDILIDGKSIKNVSRKQLIKHIGYVPQAPKLFNRTIYENINYGMKYTKDDIEKRIRGLGIGDFIDKLPNKLDTVVGRDGGSLSGGQRQIVYILRVLMQNKKIILMDEPTSAIDKANREMLMRLLKSIDSTLIIVSHDEKLFEIFDRIVMLKNGKIVKDKQMEGGSGGDEM